MYRTASSVGIVEKDRKQRVLVARSRRRWWELASHCASEAEGVMMFLGSRSVSQGTREGYIFVLLMRLDHRTKLGEVAVDDVAIDGSLCRFMTRLWLLGEHSNVGVFLLAALLFFDRSSASGGCARCTECGTAFEVGGDAHHRARGARWHGNFGVAWLGSFAEWASG